MRSRTTGRSLLPVALAAVTVTAMAVPASAQDAPPPAPETFGEAPPAVTESAEQERCAEALKVLSILKLLPSKPDIQRALCSLDQPETRPDIQEADAYTNEISSKYAADSGKAIEQNNLLGLPVEWPKSLTVHVPTVNDHWYTYTSKKP